MISFFFHLCVLQILKVTCWPEEKESNTYMVTFVATYQVLSGLIVLLLNIMIVWLQLFKMEDVSMGMWVEQFNSSMATVQYSHNWKFCQYGCMENYYTAHYQSPRQMICLWDKLARGRVQCCNFRWHRALCFAWVHCKTPHPLFLEATNSCRFSLD